MKKRKNARRALLAALALLTPACIQTCESTTSDAVLTAGLRGDIRAVSDGRGETAVTAELRVGGGLSNVYLELVGDDALTVTSGGRAERMIRRTEPFGLVRYVASLDGDASGADLSVAFTRKVDRGAPASTVTVPPAFAITSPAPDAVLSRAAEPLVISWGPASGADPMTITLSGSCIEGISRTAEVDEGRVTFPAGSLRALDQRMLEMRPMDQGGQGGQAGPQPVEAAGKCRVTVKATRTRAGRIDPGFGQGGSIVAEQTRRVEFVSAP